MMNLQDNFVKTDKILQEHLNVWDNKIFPHLPQNVEELAKKTKALQRKRGIHSVVDLLKICFLYACSDFSFRILACAAHALTVSHISDTAWRKHFSRSVPFLHELLHTMLSGLFQQSTAGQHKNVFLVDASLIRQTGACQHQERIHVCYSLSQNRINQIKVTDHHTAESLSHFEWKKGDLIMADAGYGTAQNYIWALEQQADTILRITPGHFCIYTGNGEKISVASLLKQAGKQRNNLMDIFGCCRCKDKRGFVRIIAQRLPQEQIEKAQKRRKKKASKSQKRITEDALFCAGYIVVITSPGSEYSGEEILHLYRSRWQVELLFKRFKQSFSVTVTKAGSARYAESLLLLQLIIWLIAEYQAFSCECCLREKKATANRNMIYSIYEHCKIAFMQIKMILCFGWCLFIDPTDEEYFRFLSKPKRYRKSQNEEFCMTILPGLLA